MKTKIIALCILAILSLTACTGKDTPNPSDEFENTQISQTNNSSIAESSIPLAISSDSEQDVEISDSETIQSSLISSDAQPYAEMPQSVITYLEGNTDTLKYEKSMEFGEEWLVYSSYFEYVVEIGVVLDITDDSNPTILYLHEENSNGSVMLDENGKPAPLESGNFAALGCTVGVVLDENEAVLEFYVSGDKPELHDMHKAAYAAIGLGE